MEIDEIRNGAWDDKIKAKLVGNVDSIDVPAGSQSPVSVSTRHTIDDYLTFSVYPRRMNFPPPAIKHQ